MFNGFGKCLKISVYEYEQLDEIFINAVVNLDLESLNNDYKDVEIDILHTTETEITQTEDNLDENKASPNNTSQQHQDDKSEPESERKLTRKTRVRREQSVTPSLNDYNDVLSVKNVNIDEMLEKEL